MSRGERLLGPKRNTGRGKRESTEEKETRQGKRSELNLKLNLREMRDGRGYLQKTTDMSLLLVNGGIQRLKIALIIFKMSTTEIY